MALVFMFHAKLTPSLSLHRFSLHKTTFLTFLIPIPLWTLLFALSAFISGLCLSFSFNSRWTFPFSSFDLVHKAFERCFLYSVPLSGRLRGLGSLPVGERGTVRGCQYTNTKQYPIVHPPFCFLQWEASSIKDIQWFWGPERSFDRAGTKLTDVIPL